MLAFVVMSCDANTLLDTYLEKGELRGASIIITNPGKGRHGVIWGARGQALLPCDLATVL
jgi:hypothetical protein